MDNVSQQIGHSPTSNPSYLSCRPQSNLLLNTKSLLSEYNDIYCLCKRVNNSFGIQNLFNIALCFGQITYSSYNGLVNSLDTTSYNIFLDILLWAGYYILKLVSTLKVCNDCELKGKELQRRLHEILNFTNNKALKLEVEHFLLALLQCDIHFDAYGFFFLNFSLFFSMIGSVAGYIVILVQSHGQQPVEEATNCTLDR